MKSRKNISIFEIVLLVIGTVAFSWIVGGSQEINFMDNSKDILVSIVNSFDLIPSVSALTIGSGKCCVSAKNGGFCQEITSGDCDSQCNGNCLSTSCDQVSECKLGCSIDTNEGLCTPNSQKIACENSENCKWIEDSSCNTAECNKGCCKMGLNAQFVTEQRCKKLSQLLGVQGIFQAGGDENSCIGSLGGEDTGACVYGDSDENGDRLCKFTTKATCQTNNGEFYKNYLCSNNELNTVCEKQKSTNCVDGRDGVYWFDSCGNPENIYSSDKEKSWNNGMVATANSICSSPGATCGNCNYELGSKCGLYRPGIDTQTRDGDYTCRDLNCDNAPGNAGTKQNRLNGESWCVYDGQIGGKNLIPLPSADVVGSRHFRYICVDGEVKSEPCADYRKEICVQDTKTLSTGKKIDNALCRTNMWEDCISANGMKGCEGACLAKCVTNPDCRIFPVYVDSDFKFNTCVPKYPPGFDLGETGGLAGIATGAIGSQVSDQLGGAGDILSQAGGQLTGSEGSSASQICGLASQTCIVVYKKMCPGGWKCIKNCKCQELLFTEQMNNLCVSLGDCGAYTNIAGKVTSSGASVSKKGSQGHKPPPPFIIAFQYMIFAKPLAWQRAEPGFFNEVSAINELPSYGIGSLFGDGYASLGSVSVQSGLFSSGQFGSTIGMAAGGAGIAGAAASTIGGTVTSMGSSFLFISPLGWGFIAGALILGLMYALGCGQTKKVEIKFECKPWVRPAGGSGGVFSITQQSDTFLERLRNAGSDWENIVSGSRSGNGEESSGTGNAIFDNINLGAKGCEYCNKDPLKPCTKYRCESLGMRCKLINENTGKDECVYDETVVGIPIITPWDGILNKTLFSYRNVSTNGFQIRNVDGGCIQAFTPLLFGVLTDEYAQCKISEENLKFENMDDYFFEQQLFTKNHTYATYLPSVESIIASETSNTEEFNQAVNNPEIYTYVLNKIGDINLHVKCANIDGQANEQDYRINFCVSPGPDLTAPIVVATSPAENSIVGYNSAEQQTSIFVNEPAECKWDTIKPLTTNSSEIYNSLANKMTCTTNADEGTLLGYPCNATLPIYSNESKYYILCRDQPWLGENQSRNYGASNSEIYEYKLLKSQSELKIDSISPSGNITRGTEPITVEITAKTSGGADGNALCKYKLDNYSTLNYMSETGGSTHKTILNQMTRGDYTLTINCTDSAGNNAEATGTFKLELDTTAPEITRIYYQSGDLVVLTNEDSECAYVHNDSLCGFTFENGNKMESSLSKIHKAEWISDEIYDIICRDSFGNHVGGCSAVVQPRTFPTAA